MRAMTISKMDRGGQNAVVSAGPGAIAAATRECASFAGFFKKGLSPSERERMKALLGQGFGRGARLTALEGRNSTVLFEEAAEGLEPVEAAGCGGSCVVSFTEGREGGELKSAGVFSYIEGLNGTWAVAGVDGTSGVVLARDFAGAQSAYYCVMDGCLFFASSLTLMKGLPLSISREALADFLHFLYIPAPGTIYSEVEAVLPGEAVIYDGTKVTRSPLRDALSAQAAAGPEEYLSRYEELLKASMNRACPKGSKAALFLSGGKDSSALAVAASLNGTKNVDAINLGFADASIDESSDARTVAEHLRMPFTALKFTAREYFGLFPGYAASLGQPMGDAAAMPLYAAMEALGESFGVFIDGTGNDRYFGVTTTWQEDLAWQAHRRLPGLDKLPWKSLKTGLSYSVDSIKGSLSRPREEQFVSWKGFASGEIAGLIGAPPDWRRGRLYGIYRGAASAMELKTRTLCEIWEPEAAFRKSVQIANARRRTVRYPFLDRELVTYSKGLPEGLKHNGRSNKVILRMFLKRHLPQEILDKRKGAFVFPKGYILETDGFEYVKGLLSSESLKRHGLVEPSAAAAVAGRYIKGDKGLQDRVWALVMLHAWMEFGK